MSQSLLEKLKDRKLVAQRNPFLTFCYPTKESAEITVKAKRISDVEMRQVRAAMPLGKGGILISKFYEELFRKILPNIVEVWDTREDMKQLDVKEMTELFKEHFRSAEVDAFALQYLEAYQAEENEAQENPNE